MAIVEVEEEVAKVGNLAMKVLSGKNRATLQALIVEEEPTLNIPEENARRAIAAATAPLLSEIEKLKQDRMNDQAMKNLEERRKPVSHLNTEDLKSLEQFMVDKGIANYEIALREKARLDQVATPRPVGRFGRAEMPEADKDNLLYKDPAAFRSKTLHRMIDDLHSGKQI